MQVLRAQGYTNFWVNIAFLNELKLNRKDWVKALFVQIYNRFDNLFDLTSESISIFNAAIVSSLFDIIHDETVRVDASAQFLGHLFSLLALLGILVCTNGD